MSLMTATLLVTGIFALMFFGSVWLEELDKKRNPRQANSEPDEVTSAHGV